MALQGQSFRLHGIVALAAIVVGGATAATAATFDAALVRAGSATADTRVVTFVLPPGERVLRATLEPGAGAAGATAPPSLAVSEANWRGYRLASVAVDAAGAPDGTRVRLETAPGTGAALQRLRPSPEQDARDRALLRGLVANPADVERSAPRVAPRGAVAKSGFRPSSYPDLEGSPVRYLIVTDATLAAPFQVLADWKTRRGVPAQVRTLDWIEAHARRGSDRAETLRNFLVDAYTLWGIDWVLLGGDTDVVPTREATSSVPGTPTPVPTDLYYACLDGTWNANRNGLWGEAAVNASNLGDQADLYAELYVARAPVRSVADVQTFVAKTIAYETPLATDYQDRALLLAEVLSPADYDSGQAINLDGAALTENLRAATFPGGLDLTRQYETWFSYPGAVPLHKSAALAALGQGPNLVNHMGHGFRYNMSVGDASIVNAEAEALTNGDRTFVLYLLNCTALAFDSNALGERFLMAPNGGAVGVIGASREAYPNTSIDYNTAFYSEIFARRHVHLGEAFANARTQRTAFTFFDSQDRWTHFIDNVLGDPELTIFTDTPHLATVTHPATIALGTTSVLVHVADGAAAVDSARVCLWKGDEAYATGLTDAAGDATLALGSDTPGTVLVTVSQRNLRTYQGSITVQAGAPAHLRIASASLVDDGSGGTSGNGDGVADAGETVRLALQVANAGGAPVTARARLTSPSLQAVALEDSVELGAVAPASQVPASFLVHLLPALADGSTLQFTVGFHDMGGAGIGSDALPKVVHAPRLEVVELLPSTAGATTTFAAIVKNFGSGAAPACTGTLTSADPDVAIVQGATSLGPVASFASATTTPSCVVTEATTAQRNRMHLALVDAWGRVVGFDFDLRGPVGAAKPVLDASKGPTVMRLTWNPSIDTDLLGYHVYRRLSGVGSLTRVTTDVVRAAYVLDAGLQPSTRYDWAVAAVDSSGLVGNLSPTATASTNPPQLAGWPLLLPASTSSSVAVGDIDGDGGREILVGDAGVYAWHANGVEVRDGDTDPLTWGALTGDAAVVTGAIALGEFDPARPGQEIVRANWADSRVTVYDAQGNVLPGWPRQPANGTPGYWGTPVAADLDGDGRCEVLVIGKDGRLYGWHHDGTPLGGVDGTLATVGAFTRTAPAVANLDGDPQLEIVVAGSDGFVRALERDGTPLSPSVTIAWPRNLGGPSLSSPAIAEIDGNPRTPEIVVTSENDQVHVLNAAGFELAGWPKSAPMDSPSFGPSPALGDLNGDGRAEIVVVANKNPASLSTLIVYDGATGSILMQKLLGNISESSPILADVDGNGSVDIVQGGESGVINAWSLAGQPLDGFPLTVGDFVRGTPAFDDVDGDGLAELVLAGWDRNVYVWDLTAPYVASRAPWPTYAHDAGRTGNAVRKPVSGSEDVTGAVPRVFTLGANVPNPFNPTTRLQVELPQPGETFVAVFDARGRHVRTLQRGVLGAGRHTFAWDGRDAGGRAVPSGIYWYRATWNGQVAARKMTLLK